MDAWKEYGENLDNLVSTATAGQECTPVAGAPASARADGNDAIDNAWGHSVLPLLDPFIPAISTAATDLIEAGGRTPFLALGDDIGGDGTGSSVTAATPVLSTFAFAEAAPAPPKWDGTTCAGSPTTARRTV